MSTALDKDMIRQFTIETADYMMHQASDSIDEQFGDGYAKKHPRLVAAYMQTAISIYLQTTVTTK